MYHISLNGEKHDTDLEIEQTTITINGQSVRKLNHPKERLSIVPNKKVNEQTQLSDFSIFRSKEVFANNCILDNEIMPDLLNLQKHVMWKYDITSQKDLIKILLKTFQKWQSYK